MSEYKTVDKTVDARGLSCPQPVMLARQAVSQLAEGAVEIVVDSVTSRENITRFAKTAGWEVSSEETADGDFRLVLRK